MSILDDPAKVPLKSPLTPNVRDQSFAEHNRRNQFCFVVLVPSVFGKSFCHQKGALRSQKKRLEKLKIKIREIKLFLPKMDEIIL